MIPEIHQQFPHCKFNSVSCDCRKLYQFCHSKWRGASNVPEASDEVTVLVGPVISLSKTHVEPFVVDQSGTFQITVSNIGDSPTEGLITVTDTLPSGLSFVNAVGSGWTIFSSGKKGRCT